VSDSEQREDRGERSEWWGTIRGEEGGEGGNEERVEGKKDVHLEFDTYMDPNQTSHSQSLQ